MSGRFYFTRRGLAKLHKEIEKLEKKLQDLQSQTAHVAEVGGNQWHDNAAYESLIIDIRGDVSSVRRCASILEQSHARRSADKL